MSGSVEENSVEAQGVTSPLRRIARLSAPSREAYATTPAEINALGLLNQQGGPQMIGFLAGLQSDRTNAQDAYEQQLQQVNTQQSALARMADAREGRQQDVRLATSFMNTPNAGSLLQIMQPLFTPEGARTAGQFTTTELAERTSKAALQNAQAQRALREPAAAGEERPLTPNERRSALGDIERAGDAAMRASLTASRAPNTYEISNGRVIPMPGTAPLTEEQKQAAEAARNAARIRKTQELRQLDPRYARLFPETTQPAPEQAAPATAASPQPVARTDAGSPTPADRVARARANGWSDTQLRTQLQREGMSPAQIQELLRTQ